ncbi:MAG: hypothetical protein ACOY4O_03555 [Pseudomonadota bacterium]
MAHDHAHTHSHGHDHAHHDHGHGHHHHHAPGQPHPAQAVAWSILRMPLTARLGFAATLSAVLWAIVLVVMR